MNRLMIIVAAAALLTGCDIMKQSPIAPTASQTVCMWIAADKDTYASYGRAGEEADLTFGMHGTLAVAVGPLGRKNAYVNFARPVFPEGTEITFATMELFHGGKNEDGTSDDISLNVAGIRSESWSPTTLTWNNRPDRRTPSYADFPLALRSQSWCGTPNISDHVRDMMQTPSTHYGFVVSLSDEFFARQIEKGFYSNNDIRRKQNDLGRSPRLLIKITLPAGKTMADITMPFLPADHDLGRIAQPITMVRISQSAEFPTSWEVAPSR